ncbi:carbon-nitrogen hydrolase family protein [Candidatus Poribacteria bacterium]|nr:carbon-nitrogen hydrolase family protein [Candidatus Poribacteria bacterium]
MAFITRYSLEKAFKKLSKLKNIFDVFALLHYVCKEKYADIYDLCLLGYIGDWGEFFIDWQKRAADILPPEIKLSAPNIRGEDVCNFLKQAGGIQTDAFLVACYALLLAIDRRSAFIAAYRDIPASPSELAPLYPPLNTDASLGRVYQKETSKIAKKIESLDSCHQIRTGKDRGARLDDRLENLVVIPPETLGYNIEMRSLPVTMRNKLEDIDGTLKIAVVQIIDDVSEFTIEQSSVTYGDRPGYWFSGLQNPQQVSESVKEILMDLSAQGVNIVVFPELTVPEEVLLAIKETMNSSNNLVMVIAGSFHKECEGKRFNICTVLGPGGIKLWEQKKMHPFVLMPDEASSIPQLSGSDEFKSKGGIEAINLAERKIVICDAPPIGRMVVLICLDFIVPEYEAVLRELGVNMVFVPALTPSVSNFQDAARHYGSFARASVFMANSCAVTRKRPKTPQGNSLIYIPIRNGERWLRCDCPKRYLIFDLANILGGGCQLNNPCGKCGVKIIE